MEALLRALSMETLLGRFQAQRMEPQAVLAATDAELVRLGVSTIGDRIRLRDACKRHVDERNASPVSPSTSSQTASAAREERLSIFNPRSRNRSQARVAARSSTSGARKRETKGHPWTPTFICLADSTKSKTPSAVEKQILFRAGLGLKKIKLDLEDDEHAVIDKITSETQDAAGNPMGFPQLKSCGGFEMMRCSANCRDLSVISCAWNAKDLRSSLGGGQGKMYLRPIQMSLSTQPLAEQSQCEVKEKCQMCNREVLVRKLRDHLWSCTEGLDSDSDDSQQSSSAPPSNVQQPSTSSGDVQLSSSVPPSNVQRHSTSSSNVQQSSPPPSILQQPSTTPNNIEQPSSGPPIALPLGESPSTIVQTIDLTETPADEVKNYTVDEVVDLTVAYCKENSITSHVEILRCFQQKMVTGRALDIESVSEATEGETNFIIVDRSNLMETSFEEIMFLAEYRRTLQVQFYGEAAEDYGGPRKEFFRLVLGQIKETFFDNGLRELLREKYVPIGIIIGLSLVQNGKIPTFLNDEMKKKIFLPEVASEACIAELQEGLKKVGIYQLGCQLPELLDIFKRPSYTLTIRSLTGLLNAKFSEEGSNRRLFENQVYGQFLKYIRLVASGRRGAISLAHILMFTTCTDEEPVLGFTIQPSISFVEADASDKFIPTANTCICSLVLPHATHHIPLPEPDRLYSLYDYAFSNAFFGNI